MSDGATGGADAAGGRRPGVLDRLDLWLLRAAKRRRAKMAHEAAFYETFFVDADVEKYLGDCRHAWRFGIVRRVHDALFPAGGVRVADIGCGLGLAATALPPRSAYTGVEYSGSAIAMAERIHGARGARGAAFRRGGFPDLPLESAAFDLALCLEVVEHVRDDARAIAELWRILKPGGALLISVPRSFYWPEYERLIGHFRHYDAAALARLLEGQGFRIEKRIAQFPRFWQGYHYVYLGFVAAEAVLRRAGWRRFSVYRSRPYRALGARILAALDRRYREDDPESTFVLCRKPAPADTAPPAPR